MDLFAKFSQETASQTISVQHVDRHSKIKKAINEEVKVYEEIKDIRDELNILKTVAHYQSIVQNELYGRGSAGQSLSASYIVNDLKGMDELAERIQAAVSYSSHLWVSQAITKGRADFIS
jgi:hypothetical protein